MNFVAKIPARLAHAEIISMDLRDVSMLDVLNYIAEMAGLQVRGDKHALVLEDATVVDLRDVRLKALDSKPKGDSIPVSTTLERASKIILPKVEIEDAAAAECVDFLRAKTASMRTPDGDSLAVNIVLKVREGMALPNITLFLRETPLSEVARYVAELAGLRLHAEEHALVIGPD
jgi:hypothetical protein